MKDDKSTTVTDDSTNIDANGTTNTNPITTDEGTANNSNNSNTSESDNTIATDDDKSKEVIDTDKTSISQFDSDLDDWITKRGLKVPETDTEKRSFQQMRNEQREFTREHQAKKDAEDLAKVTADAKKDNPEEDDEDTDPLVLRQNKLEADVAAERVTRMQSEFYISNKITPEEHTALLTIMKEKFTTPTTQEGKKRAFEVWSSTDALPDLLDLAKARLANSGQSVVADEAAQAEREKIERESNAKSPSRGATKTTDSNKTEDQARYERFKTRYNKS